jgi:hypothetical protein
MAGTRNADTMLGELLATLKATGLDKTTDVFVTADHGFTTISHASATSPSAHLDPSAPLVDLPSGFLAIDLSTTLGLPLRAPGDTGAPIDFSNGGKLPGGSGMLGADPLHPDVVVAANGGSDLIYLPGMNAKDNSEAKETAGSIVKFLETQDYVSGVFVNDRLGKFPGALSMSDVGLMGAARTPQPAIYVNFRSFTSGCENDLQCAVAVMDTPLATGQGNHGSFSRAEIRNFMAAIGPDFKAGVCRSRSDLQRRYRADHGHVMGLNLPAKGVLKGRVISEALAGGAEAMVQRQVVKSAPGAEGVQTILDLETVGTNRYFDAAGFAGKMVGLRPE